MEHCVAASAVLLLSCLPKGDNYFLIYLLQDRLFRSSSAACATLDGDLPRVKTGWSGRMAAFCSLWPLTRRCGAGPCARPEGLAGGPTTPLPGRRVTRAILSVKRWYRGRFAMTRLGRGLLGVVVIVLVVL